ncbi:hypothetical protein HDU98_008713 [Podochytrium sp. JEL0797]|nr:hypothetical protein HDU98_008713 [Podochytrium sp. JEL0797]
MRTANGSEMKVVDLAKDNGNSDVSKPLSSKTNSMDLNADRDMMMQDENCVYDVYFLDERVGSHNFDASAAIAIELEDEDVLCFDDSSDNEDRNEDDEDSNAEDDYRNEYPDSDDADMHEPEADDDWM